MGRLFVYTSVYAKVSMPFALPPLASKEETVESLRKTVISKFDSYAYTQNLQNIILLPKLSAADRALNLSIITSL